MLVGKSSTECTEEWGKEKRQLRCQGKHEDRQKQNEAAEEEKHETLVCVCGCCC